MYIGEDTALQKCDQRIYFLYAITQSLHHEKDATKRLFFKQSTAILKSVFSFLNWLPTFYFIHCLGSAERFTHFPRALMWNETQSNWFTIWIRVAESIFFDDEGYVKHTYSTYLLYIDKITVYRQCIQLLL